MKIYKWRKTIENKYSQLLSELILLFLLASLLDGFIGRLIIVVLFFLVILSAIRTFNLDKKRFFILLFIAGAGFFTEIFVIYEAAQGVIVNELLWLVNNVITITFLSTAIVIISQKILTEKKVSFDTIQGGICIFFLIGVLWTVFYSTVYIFDANAFSTSIETIEVFGSMFYFSFTTLTTLGYGDITPTSDLARTLANFQAIVGMLYPSIFIARLVGLYTADEMNQDD